MKNQITLILLAIFILIIIFISIYGFEIGNLKILSVEQLLEKNDVLNERILTASSLTSTEYPEAIRSLEQTYEKQQIEKQKYEEIINLADGDKNDIFETKQYDIGYLWKVIGSYATKRNLQVGMSVQKTTGQNMYNLSFTVNGEYSNIIQFISSIENNSDLNFRIYNFKMTGNGESVTSSFVVKNVNIDPETTIENNSNTTIDSVVSTENNTEKE